MNLLDAQEEDDAILCTKIKTRTSQIVVVVLIIIILSKNLKIKIYKTIILPVVLYGCEKGLLH